MNGQRLQHVRGFRDLRLHALVVRHTQVLIAAVLKATATLEAPERFPSPPDSTTLEALCLRRLHQLGPEQQGHARTTLRSTWENPAVRKRAFGELSAVDFTSAQPIATQAVRHLPSLPPAELPATLALHALCEPYLPPPAPGAPIFATLRPPLRTPAPAAMSYHVALRRLFCADETGTWFAEGVGGDDEIVLSGLAVDAIGRVTRLDSLTMGDFEDDDVRSFVPPHWYAVFNLTDGIPMPKYVTLILTLAEKDEGGFADFLEALYGQVRKDVLATLSTWGATYGVPGFVLGTIAALAAGFVLDTFVAWLAAAWRDDVFPPQVIFTELNGFLPEDALAQGLEVPDPVHFVGHDGHYVLWLNDRLVSEPIVR